MVLRIEGKIVKLRIVACGAASLVTLVGVASPAQAAHPVRETVVNTSTAVVTSLCSFPVTVTFNATAERLSFYDESGALVRIAEHVLEQDTYTANGRTLEGLPYTYNVQARFDDAGELEHVYASGLVSRVPLPDGSVFRAAGRIDFVAHGFEFVPAPDWGTPVNTAAFCAALST